jgi:hypothetical protein
MSDDPKDGQDNPLDPKEAFRQGVNLLWHAARGAVGGLRKELEKADIPGGLRDAAREMKRVADAAVHGTPTTDEETDEGEEEPQGTRIEVEESDESKPEDS